MLQLREHLVHKWAIALGYAIELSTWASYFSALQSYLTFCKAHNFPIEPTSETLFFYTIYMCHYIQPCSVNSYLSGTANQLESYFLACKSPLVSCTLASAQKQFSTLTTCKQPLSVKDSTAIVNAHPSPSHDNMLFISITFCGFFVLHCLRELNHANNSSLCDSQKAIKCSSICLTLNTLSYTLLNHKADRFFDGNIVLILKHLNAPDPLSWFSCYLLSCDTLFPL